MNELSTTHLLRDHRETERVMAALEAVLNLEPGPWTPERVQGYERVCGFFDSAVIAHLQKEDGVLFPALEEFLPRDVGPLSVLRSEHAEISTLYACVRSAGDALCRGAQNPQASQDLLRYGRKLLRVVSDHIYKEDKVLFPMVTRFLNAEQDRRLLQQMEALSPLRARAATGT